jgi:Tfp pilus assembly pilus retraction ATPase PilT
MQLFFKEFYLYLQNELGDEFNKVRPTIQQWKMIVSPSRDVKVSAPAGSGKSTTLALRIL